MSHPSDPRVVGGTYRCGYWGQDYIVLAITDYADWRGRSWRVRWADGHVTEHSTAWDARRDRVLSTGAQS
jgi:hypothetical protein